MRRANAARLPIEFLDLRGQIALQRPLPTGYASVAGDEAWPASEDGAFKATFFRPDETYDRIPRWLQVVNDLFKS